MEKIMKQHITKKQAEKSPYVFRRVASILGYSVQVYDGIIEGHISKNLLEEINIGFMINVLREFDCDVKIISSGQRWYIGVAGHINTEGDILCDVLWQTVEIIEK
jgi:hypothetical protein